MMIKDNINRSLKSVVMTNEQKGKTMQAIEAAKRQENKSRFKWRYTLAPAAVACACLAIAILVIPMFDSDNVPNHSGSLPQTAISSAPVSSQMPEKRIVVSSKYNGGMVNSLGARPGTVYIAEEVQKALDDPSNKDAYFYVLINAALSPSKMAEYSMDTHSYNGRTIAEWSVLADLANEEYPYNEYNRDFGGNVSEAEWQRAIAEAKTAEAQKNYDEGVSEYNNTTGKSMDKAVKALQTSECDRLKAAGYDVFLSDTGDCTGLLTAEEIQTFNANSENAYTIEWVRDENGVVDYDETLRSASTAK